MRFSSRLPLLVVLAFASSARADGAAPADSPYAPRDGRVAFVAGGREAWNYPLTAPEANATIHVQSSSDRATLFACADFRAFALDASTGVVKERWYLPGRCESLAVDGAAMVATCDIGEGSKFEFRSDDARARSAAMLPSAFGFIALRQQAERTLDAKPAAEREPERARRIAQDPTNPWWRFVRIESRDPSLDAGDVASLDALDPRYRVDLLVVSSSLPDARSTLSDKAFELGYEALTESGYEPELATSLIGMLRFLPPGEPLFDIDRDYDALARRARRLLRLAPHVEGSVDFYRALEAAAQRKQKTEDAQAWARAAEQAEPFRLFGGSARDAKWTGHAVDAGIAMMWAVVLVLIAKLVRNSGASAVDKPSRLSRWSSFTRWTLAERFGLSLAALLTIGLTWYAAWGVAQIGAIAAAPAELGNGSLGHPAALKYTERFVGSPGGDFIRGLALQQAGRADEARAIYGRSTLERARLNANALSDPNAPLQMPSLDDWTQAWRSAAARATPALHNPFTAITSLSHMSNTLSTNAQGSGGTAGIVLVLTILMMALPLLPLLPPYRKAYQVDERSKRVRVIDWLVPGASSAYGLMSFLFAGALSTWLVGRWMLMSSGGAALTLLDSIALPAYARYFRVESLPSTNADATMPFYAFGGALFVVHFAVLGVRLALGRRASQTNGA